MRWPTVVFGALPASVLAFPAALALLLGVGLFQPSKLITWVFIICGTCGWTGMISLWIAARNRDFGRRTAVGLALGIVAAVTFILLKFLHQDMAGRMPLLLAFLALGPIIVSALHLKRFTRTGGWHPSPTGIGATPPPLPAAPGPRLPTILKGMLFAEIIAALLLGPVLLNDPEEWGALTTLICTFPFLLAFWLTSGWTFFKHRPLRVLAAAVFILPFLMPPALKLCEHLMGPESASRALLVTAAAMPLLCVVLLPRQVALFIPGFLLHSRVFQILIVLLQVLMILPFGLFVFKLPAWLNGDITGLVMYAVWHTGFSVASGILTLCCGYLGLFQKGARRQTALNITQLILGLILLALSLPLAWMILIVLGGGLVG